MPLIPRGDPPNLPFPRYCFLDAPTPSSGLGIFLSLSFLAVYNLLIGAGNYQPPFYLKPLSAPGAPNSLLLIALCPTEILGPRSLHPKTSVSAKQGKQGGKQENKNPEETQVSIRSQTSRSSTTIPY